MIQAEGYAIDFPKATNLYLFDQTDNMSPYFHGVNAFKKVDVMAEFPDRHLWIEIKTYNAHTVKSMMTNTKQRVTKEWLRDDLVGKFKDTFLYRYAEKQLKKPIYYVCLMDFGDEAKFIYEYLNKELKIFLPNKSISSRWKIDFVSGIIVLNPSKWNRTAELAAYGKITKL